MFDRWMKKSALRESLREIAVDDISVNPYQPRRDFDQEKLLELSESIREQGLLQPVIVRPLGGGYELIAGERRLRASRLAGLKAIPALVKETADGQEMMEMALVENVQREQLNEVEEAEAYGRLMAEHHAMSDEAVSGRVGKSLDEIRSRFWMLSLSPVAKKALASRVIGPAAAEALSAIPDEAAQDRLLRRAYREKLSPSEVRAAALRVRKSLGDPAALEWEFSRPDYGRNLSRLHGPLAALSELIARIRRSGVSVDVTESGAGGRLDLRLSFDLGEGPKAGNSRSASVKRPASRKARRPS